ncbi:MAG: diguanylate cyclase (GGDEF)-like protein [Halieaceae bacterium]
MNKIALVQSSNRPASTMTQRKLTREKTTLPSPSDSCLLSLHQKLQATLDHSILVHRFFEWLKAKKMADGIVYQHPQESLDLIEGSGKHHLAQYVISLDDRHDLGTITVNRRCKYDDSELATLETYISVLALYLKNAIEYDNLHKVALLDSLTNMMNRTALDELLLRETDRAHRHGTGLSVLMIDVDKFKYVNDHLGHSGGDRILQLIAQTISAVLRNSDLSFRYGGDEFLVILPNTDINGAHTVADQIIAAMKKIGAEPDAQSLSPSVSIGAASLVKGDTTQDLVNRADVALYRAKDNGRNCYK